MNKISCTNCHNRIYAEIGIFWRHTLTLQVYPCSYKIDGKTCYRRFLEWYEGHIQRELAQYK